MAVVVSLLSTGEPLPSFRLSSSNGDRVGGGGGSKDSLPAFPPASSPATAKIEATVAVMMPLGGMLQELRT